MFASYQHLVTFAHYTHTQYVCVYCVCACAHTHLFFWQKLPGMEKHRHFTLNMPAFRSDFKLSSLEAGFSGAAINLNFVEFEACVRQSLSSLSSLERSCCQESSVVLNDHLPNKATFELTSFH